MGTETRRKQSAAVWVETEIDLPHPALDLWPFVADANRMDRAVGLPPAQFTRTPRPEGGETVVGEYRMARILIARWHEHPFEWQRPRRYSVVRDYDFGPIKRFFGGVELTEIDEGTRLKVFAEFTPRLRIFRPWLRWWVGPVTMKRAREQYLAFSAFLNGRTFNPYPTLSPDRRLVKDQQVNACAVRLSESGVPPDIAERLQRLIIEASDEDVGGMRPLELARAWGTDPMATVRTFLQATVAGLLEMRWEFLCPSCRGVKANAPKLRELELTGYCAACNLPFAASVDEGIEARFYPTDAVRRLRIGTYCIGNPMNTPHRIAQTTLDPGEHRTWRLEFEPGPYLIRSPQSTGICRISVDPGSETSECRIELTTERMRPESISVKPGEVDLQFVNTLDAPTTVAIDDAHWSDTATTPSRMLTIPEYNTLFSGEALASGVELSVGRVGLLFSDLASSTALYERAGEALAFRIVTEHFELLRSAVEANGGAVVKTIGDAVMASFPDGRSALHAALDAQERILELDTHDLADPGTLLKIGVHVGPAYLVTLNERLDYFGTSVNIAARAQREANSGEIVLTNQVLEEAGNILESAGVQTESFDMYLKGISHPVRLTRATQIRTPTAEEVAR